MPGTYVNLRGLDIAKSDTLLKEVQIPRIKTMPGFQAGRFLRSVDNTSGVGAVIFDTEANARAALDVMTTNRPPEAPRSTGPPSTR
jgi:hypothetical protein